MSRSIRGLPIRVTSASGSRAWSESYRPLIEETPLGRCRADLGLCWKGFHECLAQSDKNEEATTGESVSTVNSDNLSSGTDILRIALAGVTRSRAAAFDRWVFSVATARASEPG